MANILYPDTTSQVNIMINATSYDTTSADATNDNAINNDTTSADATCADAICADPCDVITSVLLSVCFLIVLML